MAGGQHILESFRYVSELSDFKSFGNRKKNIVPNIVPQKEPFLLTKFHKQEL